MNWGEAALVFVVVFTANMTYDLLFRPILFRLMGWSEDDT